MKKYRVWIENNVNPKGGWWWECYLGKDGKLHDYIYTDEQYKSLQWYIDNGYKVEEL